MAEPTDPTSDGQRESNAELLTELVAHLRNNRTQLRQEWARRIGEARLLTALTQEEIFSEATSVYDNYVEVLETGSVEALQDYARNLSERIIPRGVESSRIASCCWRMTRSRSPTKLPATMLEMRLAAGS